MDIRHLKYFVTLCDELHFGRAATRLHIVQPALSQQIQRLERELGVTLLWRNKREVRVTEAGAVLYERAKPILEEVDRAAEDTKRAARGAYGRLALGFVSLATNSVLPDVLRAYLARYPEVHLDLHEATTTDQLARLHARTLDIGFIRLPIHEPDIVTETVLREPIVALLPASHRLARSSALDLTELAEDPFILVPQAVEPMVYAHYIAQCEAAGFVPQVVYETERIMTVVALVAAGVGVSLIPESAAKLGANDTIAVPVRNLQPLELAAAMPEERAAASVGPFLDVMREAHLLPAPRR